jgi:hypothetical protein
MNRRTLALVLLLLCFLVACQGDDGGQQAATTTTANVAVETTAATTTTRAPDAKVQDATQKHVASDGSSANITVFRYRDREVVPGYVDAETKKQNKRTVAIEVRTCITKNASQAEGDITLSWGPWSVGDDSGGGYEAFSAYSDQLLVQPLYPQSDKPTPVGTCRRGWIAFDIGSNARPTFIEYNAGDGNILKWRIRR